MNGRTDLLEGAAAADVGDRSVNVGVGRLRLFRQQRTHRHDHAGLAVAALRHLVLNPGFLHFGQHAVGGQTFNRCNLFLISNERQPGSSGELV